MKLIEAFRLTEALLHAAGHWTSLDQGMKEADEIVAKMDRGVFVPTYTAAELIAKLRLVAQLRGAKA